MKRNTLLLLFTCSLLAFNHQIFANNFFTTLSPLQVQQIFDEADKSAGSTFLINSSDLKIPVVQILPVTNNARSSITSATQCIKLYNCNQGICLIGIDDKKYATNEQLLASYTSEQQDSESCLATTDTAKTVINEPATKTIADNKKAQSSVEPQFSWVKVINVTADDQLNIRQTKDYKSNKLGSASANATCIKRFRCEDKWCQIEQQSTTGWVHRSFIEKMDEPSAQQC
ncbi:SH3 domain-containing protein [Gammaproteobacteria bacterium AS21]